MIKLGMSGPNEVVKSEVVKSEENDAAPAYPEPMKFEGDDAVPAYWILDAVNGEFVARNTRTGRVFKGELEDFNKALRS